MSLTAEHRPAQMMLFADEKQSVTFVQRCHLCGEPVSTVVLDDAGAPWHEPMLWSYIAQKQHEKECHISHGDELEVAGAS